MTDPELALLLREIRDALRATSHALTWIWVALLVLVLATVLAAS